MGTLFIVGTWRPSEALVEDAFWARRGEIQIPGTKSKDGVRLTPTPARKGQAEKALPFAAT